MPRLLFDKLEAVLEPRDVKELTKKFEKIQGSTGERCKEARANAEHGTTQGWKNGCEI